MKADKKKYIDDFRQSYSITRSGKDLNLGSFHGFEKTSLIAILISGSFILILAISTIKLIRMKKTKGEVK